MSDDRPLTPRKRPAPVDVDDGNDDGGQNEPAPMETPITAQQSLTDFESPADGQTMRSGLKKRRRDAETTGLTPEEEVLDKRRARMAAALTPVKKKPKEDGKEDNDQVMTEATGNDVSKDEEMEDTPQTTSTTIESAADEARDEEMQEADKMPPPPAAPTNGNHVAPVANGDAKKTLPPIGSLRMPSQHTPGKLASRETARLHPLDNGGSQHMASVDSLIATASATERLNHALQEQRSAENSSVAARKGPPMDGSIGLIKAPPQSVPPEATGAWKTVHEAVPPKIIPTSSTTTAPDPVSHGEGPYDDDDEVLREPRRSRLAFMDVWFTLILLVHFYWQYQVYPVWPKVREISDTSILLYKDLLGIEPKKVIKETQLEKQVVVEQEEEEVVRETLDTGELDTLLSAVVGSIEQLRKAKSDSVSSLEEAKSRADETGSQLDEIESTIERAEAVLRKALEDPSSESIEHARDLLNSGAKINWLGEALVTEDLLEEREEPFWVPPDMVAKEVKEENDCGAPPKVPVANFITPDDLERRKKELEDLASTSIARLVSNPNVSPTAEEWAREQILLLLRRDLAALSSEDTTTTSVVDEEESPSTDGMTEQEVLGIIHDELEVDLADGTGMLDYASLYGGARVIRSGPRATSPSLVDTLPMLNRMMALANLRFYGYGPEAAMTPTTPPDSLGQCWAFEDVSVSKKARWRDANRNDPSNGKFATLTLGFAKPIAVTEVVLEHPARSSRQPTSAISNFRLLGYADAEATGRPIRLGGFAFKLGSPRSSFRVQSKEGLFIQSLTLAIDDNHGFSYSCLYRFRVHGTEQGGEQLEF